MTRPSTQRAATLAARALSVRWLVRAPIWLLHARLGFLMGSRLLMLEHIGRRSGRRRHVVLEVVDRPAPGRYVVASGFGGAVADGHLAEVYPEDLASVDLSAEGVVSVSDLMARQRWL